MPGPDFDNIDSQYSLLFSPDGRHLAYEADNGGKCFAVVDQKPSQPFEPGNSPHPRFSANSQHVFYTAKTGGNVLFFLDGNPHDYRELDQPVFSPDGKHLAVTKGDIIAKSVVLDDQAGPPHNIIVSDSMVFSADSQHFAYIARDTGKGDAAVVDGVMGPYFDSVTTPVFTPDSKHYSYVGHHNGPRGLSGVDDRTIVIDGKPQTTYPEACPPVFRPDSQHFAYVAAITTPTRVYGGGAVMIPQSAEFIVSDGVEGPKMIIEGNGLDVFRPVFSADSQLAYVAEDGGNTYVLLNGVKSPPFTSVTASTLTFSPDGKHLAYLAQKDPTSANMCLDGKPGPDLSSRLNGLPRPIFSPDSQHLAYAAPIAAVATVVWDGAPGPAFDDAARPMTIVNQGAGSTGRWGPVNFSMDSKLIA